MAEPMSDERLAEIRQAAEQYRGSTVVRRKRNGAIAHRAELLAELDRVRTERNDNAQLAADFLGERNDARAKLAEVRGQLAELGRVEYEIGIQRPGEDDAQQHCGFSVVDVRARATEQGAIYVERVCRRGKWKAADGG